MSYTHEGGHRADWVLMKFHKAHPIWFRILPLDLIVEIVLLAIEIVDADKNQRANMLAAMRAKSASEKRR